MCVPKTKSERIDDEVRPRIPGLFEAGIGGRDEEHVDFLLSEFNYIVGENTVAVEGTTYGADKEGAEWNGGKTPGGRFCSVFEFRESLISRMHIYLDPDYTGRDRPRFLWGENRQW